MSQRVEELEEVIRELQNEVQRLREENEELQIQLSMAYINA